MIYLNCSNKVLELLISHIKLHLQSVEKWLSLAESVGAPVNTAAAKERLVWLDTERKSLQEQLDGR